LLPGKARALQVFGRRRRAHRHDAATQVTVRGNDGSRDGRVVAISVGFRSDNESRRHWEMLPCEIAQIHALATDKGEIVGIDLLKANGQRHASGVLNEGLDSWDKRWAMRWIANVNDASCRNRSIVPHINDSDPGRNRSPEPFWMNFGVVQILPTILVR